MHHPLLIIIRGLPGSGKTYIAERLQKALQERHGNNSIVMLDPDATDYQSQAYLDHVQQQVKEKVDPALHPYRFLRAQAYDGITSNKIILWNQPFTNLNSFQKVTTRLQEYAQEHKAEMPVLVVEVEIDPAKAKTRVDERKQAGVHGPSDTTFDRFVGDYKSFASNGYDTVTVYGDHDANESVSTVFEIVEKMI